MYKPGWVVDCRRGIRRWLDQLLSTSQIGVFALAFSLLIVLIEFLMHLKDARELMTSLVVLGLKIKPQPTKVEIHDLLFFALSFGAFFSLTFFLLWIRAEYRHADDKTVRTLRGVMRAAGHICNRLFPEGDVSDLTIEKIHFVYQIQKDFTSLVRRTYQIRAGKDPVYFIERGFRVRDHADPAESLIDIDFQVRDLHDPNGIVYLPMVNERKNKSACVFFLPRIEPEEARTFEVSYTWPRMARSLKIEGEEEFTVRHSSAKEMIEFCMEIYLEPGSGGSLSWEESGQVLPNKTLCESKSQLNWPGVKYMGINIPSAVADSGIRLRLRWKASQI
jgi:hypothetical protein